MNEDQIKRLLEASDLFFDDRGIFYFGLPVYENGKKILKKCPLLTFDDLLNLLELPDVQEMPVDIDKGMKVAYDVFQTYCGDFRLTSDQVRTQSFDVSSKKRAKESYHGLRKKLYKELETKPASEMLESLKSVAMYKKISEFDSELTTVDSQLFNFANELSSEQTVNVKISEASNPISRLFVKKEGKDYAIEVWLQRYLIYGHEKRKFYRFPSAKISTKITNSGDTSPARIFSRIRNPFQKSENICIVTEHTSGISDKSEMAKMVLSDAIGTVIGGYHSGANPYVYLKNSLYDKLEVSKQTARQLFDSGKVYIHPRYLGYLPKSPKKIKKKQDSDKRKVKAERARSYESSGSTQSRGGSSPTVPMRIKKGQSGGKSILGECSEVPEERRASDERTEQAKRRARRLFFGSGDVSVPRPERVSTPSVPRREMATPSDRESPPTEYGEENRTHYQEESLQADYLDAHDAEAQNPLRQQMLAEMDRLKTEMSGPEGDAILERGGAVVVEERRDYSKSGLKPGKRYTSGKRFENGEWVQVWRLSTTGEGHIVIPIESETSYKKPHKKKSKGWLTRFKEAVDNVSENAWNFG
ncbi:MAG: hypothetical protein GOU99_03350 [Candidatus Altiarchaeota archaeon]|nr:hypothetical protein [Candidatus Altiarchaeota archaeon]